MLMIEANFAEFELILLKPPSLGVEFSWTFLFSLSLSDEVSHSFGFAFTTAFFEMTWD